MCEEFVFWMYLFIIIIKASFLQKLVPAPILTWKQYVFL